MALRLEEMLLIDGYVLGGCWGIIRLSPCLSDSRIGTTNKGTDLRERPKVVFLTFAYSHIRSSSSRWVSHLHTNSSKTPGPVLISTSVFLMQSIQGKLWPWFSGLNKDSSTLGSRVKRSSTLETQQDAKNEITYWKLVWGEEFQLHCPNKRSKDSSSQRIVGSAQIS